MKNFDKFRLEKNDRSILEKYSFDLKKNVIKNISFKNSCNTGLHDTINNNPNILNAGLYLWTFIIDNVEFKLYVGSANERKSAQNNKRGMAGRFSEYIDKFHPSSPNDYKIKFFENFLGEVKVSFNFYYSERNDSDLRAIESRLRKEINPLFDNTNFFKEDKNKEKIKNCYQEEYNVFFNHKNNN